MGHKPFTCPCGAELSTEGMEYILKTGISLPCSFCGNIIFVRKVQEYMGLVEPLDFPNAEEDPDLDVEFDGVDWEEARDSLIEQELRLRDKGEKSSW